MHISRATGYTLHQLLNEISANFLQVLFEVVLEVKVDDLYWEALGRNINEEGFELLEIALKDEEDEEDKKARKAKEAKVDKKKDCNDQYGTSISALKRMGVHVEVRGKKKKE